MSFTTTELTVPEYAAGTRVEHFAWWCETYLEHFIDQWAGEPFRLEPWQMDFMAEALAVDEDESSVWRSVALVLPRKNGKTSMLAAYALYDLLENPGSPEVLLAAGSDKQAGRMFDSCIGFLARSDELRERVAIRQHIGEISRIDSPGKILRMSSKGETLHGYNPSLVVCDELHGWTTPRLTKAWSALTTAGGARQRTQVFTITTAGEAHERADGILGRLIDGNAQRGELEERPGLRVSRNLKGETLVWEYTAKTDDREDVDSMLIANPASWITRDYLLRQINNAELRDHEVLQLHGNVWAEKDDEWLPAGSWRKLADPSIEVLEGDTVVLGFDGSYNNDSTALVGVKVGLDKPHVFLAAVWERPERAREWRVDRADVKATIAYWLERYDVRRLCCDPPGWLDTIEEWEETYGEPPIVRYETKQLSNMAPACDRFYTAVVNGDVTHDGDPVLEKHIGHARIKETPNGAHIVKDGRNSPRKIDAAVAAVVALDMSADVHTEVGGIEWA